MAYIKYKEVTKYFNFSRYLHKDVLPKYAMDYVFKGEEVLASYKTSRDYGIFTNKKIILFDNHTFLGIRKQVYVIPYKSLSSVSIIFELNRAELSIFLDSGYPVRLKFVNIDAKDKSRLRILFSCICCYSNDQEPNDSDYKKLIKDDFNN